MMDARRFAYLQALEIPVWRERSAQVSLDGEQAHCSADTLDWPGLEKQIQTCQACPLHQTRKHAVAGTGPRCVDVCVIGEAPGAEEDRQGKPFVGRAGQLLTQMLASIGYARDQVYITNILKCRPPGNRDPQPEEIAQCLPYLHQQLQWLQPKVLLLLGRIAAQTFLQTQKPLRLLRASAQSYSDGVTQIPVIVTYHPAYLLRKPADKVKALEDLLRLKGLL